jgi:DNA repair exonuclease SbcCD ATPase subunit
MILRRLRVEHFRRHNIPVDIEFDERLTIVAGLNEAGKTTLFEALKYAFFRRSGATGKDIEGLAPWGRPGLSPSVTVDFEHQGAEYQLAKNWGKRGGTQLAKRNASGLLVPLMAENADDFLATVFAGQPPKQGQFSSFTGQHMGLAYLLFVPQGSVPIAGAPKDIGLHTDAQARLTEILGAASQSPEGARLGKMIGAAYDKVFTSKGQRRAGAPATQVQTEIDKLEALVEEMRGQVASFESAADALDIARGELQEAAAAANEAKSAAEASRPRYQAAVDLRAALGTAQRDLQLAQQRYEDLVDENRQIENALSDLKKLGPAREARAVAVATAETAHGDAERKHSEAVRALRVATAPNAELERLERELAAARGTAKLRQQTELLKQKVTSADNLRQQLEEIDAKRALDPVTQADLDRLRDLLENERGLEIRLEAAQTSLDLVAERPLTVAWQIGDRNERKSLEAGERLEVAADGRLVLELEGVALFEIHGPVNDAGELRKELSRCKTALAEVESQLGTRDPARLQKRLNALQDRERDRARFQSQLEELLDGNTIESQKRALQDLEASVASAPEGLSAEELEALFDERKSAAAAAIAELNAAIEPLADQLRKRHDELAATRKAQSATDDEWRRLEATVARLVPEGESPADRKAKLNAAYAERFGAEHKVDEARAAYGPYQADGDPLQELNRLQELANETMRAEEVSKARVKRLEQDLAEGYAQAPSSQLTELEEELDRLRAKLADEEVTEDALRLLENFVTEADAKRVENFAQPVLKRVAPWFQQVTGNELMRLDLSGDNQVTGLRLAGVDHEVRFDELSQGTCDQLALLIRLAFASLLTQPQCLGPMPVLLDDPLVHADWERRPRFGKILEDISSTAQVIVFTCRPEDYARTSGLLIALGDPVPATVTAGSLAAAAGS